MYVLYLRFFKVATLCLDNFAHSWHSLNQLHKVTCNAKDGYFKKLKYKIYFDLLDNVANVETLAIKLATLYADPPLVDGTPVQIMTMHKAKGLEFDTVIIPGLNRVPRRPDKPLLLWNERPTSHLIMAPINATGNKDDPIYHYLQFEDKQRNYYETGRLLYVASTRARKALHLLACVDDKPKNGSLLEQLLY